jgi:actin-related protein
MEGENEAIIIDTGSYLTRAGLSGSDQPKVRMPTIIGKPKVSGAFSVD